MKKAKPYLDKQLLTNIYYSIVEAHFKLIIPLLYGITLIKALEINFKNYKIITSAIIIIITELLQVLHIELSAQLMFSQR